jgi:hypothetical protein
VSAAHERALPHLSFVYIEQGLLPSDRRSTGDLIGIISKRTDVARLSCRTGSQASRSRTNREGVMPKRQPAFSPTKYVGS